MTVFSVVDVIEAVIWKSFDHGCWKNVTPQWIEFWRVLGHRLATTADGRCVRYIPWFDKAYDEIAEVLVPLTKRSVMINQTFILEELHVKGSLQGCG